ncbi:MAG: hypothetical protein ACFB16_06755 [Phormidesmis sp.]
MIFFVLLSFLPFLSAFLLNLSLSWQRCLLLFPVTLLFIHLSTGWRWQLVPAYIVVFGLILFGLWATFPVASKLITLPQWISVRWAIAIKVIFSALLISAAVFLTWAFPEIDFPTPTGPYAVGTTLETTQNSNFRLWYPAAEQQQPAATAYTYLEGIQVPGLPKFIYSQLQGKKTAAFVDIPMASNPATPRQKGHPVIIYDHGANSFRDDNTFRLMELASHGFVVAAIAHPRPFENYNISTQMAQDPALFNERLASLVVPERVKDVHLTVQQLNRLNAEEGRFEAQLNLDSLGLLGYSLGGSVLSEYCLEDRHCTAVVNLDGGSFGQARQGVPAAFLQLSQSVALPPEPIENPKSLLEKTGAYYRQEVSDLLRHTQATHPTYWLQVKGSGHAAFTDLVHWTPVRAGFLKMLMGQGDPSEIASVINNLTNVFFSEHLRFESRSESRLETAIQQHSELLKML